jgi:transposase
MEEAVVREAGTMAPEACRLEEERMVQEDRWREIHRMAREEQLPIAEIARRLDLDRKTVRRCLKQAAWRRYQREARTDTLLAEHAEFLRERAPKVGYSAQVLFQELKGKGYPGSYDTVKRFVQPLRAVDAVAERASVRFETPPGEQSQIDWGSARVLLRHQPIVLHLFVLTLGYSRRHYMEPTLNERVPQLLDAHERAFDHFGGHTREHLYDRPRTICSPDGAGSVVWNPTFLSFMRYWGIEARLCRPYRARTKGKVESGVKYLKRNFLAGRSFVDLVDVQEQWAQWNADVADVRVHGTTHQPPLERFAAERLHLLPRAGRPGFKLEARFTRVVADDFLVSLDSNRYSVPFTLIGHTVEVERRDGQVRIHHRGKVVASHAELPGRHGLVVLPEHGPGPAARNARQRRGTPPPAATVTRDVFAVEQRDLATYEALAAAGGER